MSELGCLVKSKRYRGKRFVLFITDKKNSLKMPERKIVFNSNKKFLDPLFRLLADFTGLFIRSMNHVSVLLFQFKNYFMRPS